MLIDALKTTTHIIPGHRVEFRSEELTVGDEVEIVVTHLAKDGNKPQFDSAIAFLDSLMPVNRTPEEWQLIEEEFQKDRGSWDA